jgi:hypothetical protein
MVALTRTAAKRKFGTVGSNTQPTKNRFRVLTTARKWDRKELDVSNNHRKSVDHTGKPNLIFFLLTIVGNGARGLTARCCDY